MKANTQPGESILKNEKGGSKPSNGSVYEEDKEAEKQRLQTAQNEENVAAELRIRTGKKK